MFVLSQSVEDHLVTALVRYQHTPSALKQSSHYLAAMKPSGIAHAVRRPDVIVELRGHGRRSYCLIEAKRSDQSGYIKGGVYKCHGYIDDFSDVLEAQRGGPRAVLVAWAGVNAPVAPAETEVCVVGESDAAWVIQTVVAGMTTAISVA